MQEIERESNHLGINDRANGNTGANEMQQNCVWKSTELRLEGRFVDRFAFGSRKSLVQLCFRERRVEDAKKGGANDGKRT